MIDLRWVRRTLGCALALFMLQVPASAFADDAEPGWLRRGLLETRQCLSDLFAPCPIAPEGDPRPRGRSLGTLLLVGGATLGVYLGAPRARNPAWEGGFAADDSIRRAFLAGSRSGRDAARITSDVLLGALGIGLAADWIWSDDYGLGESLTTDMGWLMGSLLTVQTTKILTDRERPYADECDLDGGYHIDCGTRNETLSFFSGHASTSATLAGLLCARHLAREERRTRDWGICGAASAASFATGVLRVVSDAHYVSDIAVGWAVGATFGYVLPRAFDYRGEAGPFSRIPAISSLSVAPVVGTRRWGLNLGFAF